MTTAAQDRVLLLLRHSKAVPYGYHNDHERELTNRGHRDARAVGEWLHAREVGIDQVLCSTAVRTQQTAEGVWSGGCAQTAIHYDRRIYDAPASRLLEVLREADDVADVVMLVGHAPGIPALASLLADGEGSHEAHEALSRGYPTSGLAMLHYTGRWSDLAFGAARLERFHVARD